MSFQAFANYLKRFHKPGVRLTTGTLVSVSVGMLYSTQLYADLDIIETSDPTTLINTIIAPDSVGIVVNNVVVFGADGQIGTFTNGLSVPGFVTYEEGVILSSGNVNSIVGPNTGDGTGSNMPTIAGADGDPDFNSLTIAPQGTFDGAYIEITFTPEQDVIRGTFTFASDEYNEYAPPAGGQSAGNTYYDVMAFFVNGVNQSLTAGGENVSINTINETYNSADFLSNDPSDGTPTPYNIEADGFTRKLTWTANVNPGVENTLKFGVADGGDASYNSWLLVDKYAFKVAPAPVDVDLTITKTDNTTAVAVGSPLTYEFDVTNVGTNPTGRELVVTDTLPAGVTVNNGVASAILESGVNADEWTCQSTASTPQQVICKSTVDIYTGTGNATSTFAFTTDPISAALDGTTLLNDAVISTTDNDVNNANDSASDATLVTTVDVTSTVVSIEAAPTLVIDTNPFSVTIDFNESVVGFDISDLVVANGTASNLVDVGNNNYTVDISPDANGDITIEIPAGSVQDNAGNPNSASNVSTTQFNTSAVDLVISNVPAYVANTDPYVVTLTFSEPVIGFVIDDIQTSNAIASSLIETGPGVYTVEITPDGTGDIDLFVPGAVATDTDGFDANLEASAVTVYNVSAPIVDIYGAPTAVSDTASYAITFEFSEAVTNFDAADVAVANGALGNFVAVDSNTYTADVTPNGNGNIAIAIPVGVAQDVAGNGNQASKTETTVFDNVGPILSLQGLPPVANTTSVIPLIFEFDEDVIGFSVTDVSVTNGSLNNFVVVDGNTYSAELVPSGAGNIIVAVATGAAADSLGNDSVAAQSTMVYDDQPPVVTMSTVAVDNIINATEDNFDVVVQGTVAGLEAGQNVIVSIDGVDYVTTTNAGNWSTVLPAVAAQALDINEDFTATATDIAGNTSTPAIQAIVHDATAPATPAVNGLLTNNISPTISGTAIVGGGDTLTVAVDGITYTTADTNLTDNGDGTWTLSIPSENALVEGVYNVIAVVTDSAGNKSNDASDTELTVDTTAPATPLIAVDLATTDDSGGSASDNITNVTTGEFSVPPGTVTAGELITLFANAVAVGSTTSAGDGSFNLPTSALAAGSYVMTYTVTDAAQNTSATSPQLNIIIDTATVVPTVDTPIAGDNVVNSVEVNVVLATGTAEPNSTVVVAFDDGVVSPVQISVVTNGSGNWTLSGNEADISGLADGVVTVSVVATDIAGNTNVSTAATITLDVTAPAVPTVNTLLTNDKTPALSGTAITASGDTLSVTLNGVTYLATESNLTDNADGTWTLLVPVEDALTQATYDVAVSLSDSHGNTVTDASSNELQIDTTSPAIPSVTAMVSNSPVPVISGSAVIVAGDVLTVEVNSVIYTAGDGDLVDNGDGSWALGIPVDNSLSDGTFNVIASITDGAGNVSTDNTASELSIDTVAPIEPSVTAQVTRLDSPVIVGTATVAPGEILTVELDGVVYNVGDSALVDNGDGTWVLTVPPANALPDGLYNVTAIVSDSAGNISGESSSGELTIDSTAPLDPLVVLNLIDADDSGISSIDNVTNIAIATFDVPAATANSGEVVELFANGASVGTGTVTGDGSFTLSTSSLPDGNYSMTYTLTDVAGNTSAHSPSLNMTVDSTTSVPLITTPIEIDGIANATEHTDVLVRGYAEADSAISVTLSDGVNPTLQVSVTAAADGTWTLLGNEIDISGLNEGTITVDALATDIAGNGAAATQVSFEHVTTVPSISINAISLDNIINAAEDDFDITVSGTTTDIEDGQIVTASIDGKIYTAVVGSNVWSFILPAADAQVLGNNTVLSADVGNAAGNAAVPATQAVTHDITVPELTIDAVSTDNRINAAEDDVDIVITGTSTGIEDGQSVLIALNGQNYSGIVNAGGWSVTIPSADAQALPTNDAVSANASDVAGNAALTAIRAIVHDTVAPLVAITVAPIATGANSETYVVGGTCTIADSNVTVSIAGATPALQAVLCNSDGEWVASFDVSTIADGSNAIVINGSQSDSAGNTTTAATVQADKNTSIPSISINVVAGDDYINAAEDDADLVISGTTTNVEDAQVATITLNGTDYTATVTADAWIATIPQANVAALDLNEAITANVSNAASTAANEASRSIIHDTTAPASPAVTTLVTNQTEPVISGLASLSSGDILEVIVNAQTYVAGDGDLVDNGDGTWTLTIPLANSLGEGVYDVTVVVTDVAGNVSSEATSNELEIDISGPGAGAIAPNLIAADDSGVSDTDNTTNILGASFNTPAGTFIAGDTVILYADGIEVGSGSIDGDGSFTVLTSLPGNGVYAMSYTLTDPAGNVSALSPELTITVDNNINAPEINAGIELDDIINEVEQGDVLVSGTAEPFTSVVVSFDDSTNPPVLITVVTGSDGIWTLLGNEADIAGLNEGVIVIGAIATDIAGNIASATQRSVIHDSTGNTIPTVSFIITNSNVPSIAGTSQVLAGDILRVLVNGVTYTAGAGALVDNGDGTWVLNIPTANALTDAIYAVEARIIDEAGNVVTDATSNELTVDTVAPATPTVATQITNDSTPTIVGTVTLLAGESLLVTVDGVEYTTADELVVPGDGTWSLTIPVADALVDGNYSIGAVAQDAAGNMAQDIKSNELRIDTTAPMTPTVEFLVSSNATPAIKGTATVLSGEVLTITVDSITYIAGDGNLEYLPSGSWTLAISPDNALVDGTYEVLATTTDHATNASSDVTSLEVTVDTIAPNSPTVVSVITNTTTPTITGTALLGVGDTLSVTVAGVDYPATGTDLTDHGDGTWTLIIPAVDALSQADYDVSAVVTDSAGNSSIDNSAGELVVDTTAPLVPSIENVLANTSTPNLSGTVSLAAGETLNVEVNGVIYNEGTDLVVTGNSWSLTIPEGAEIADGTFDVVATVNDQAGNASLDISSDELTIDTAAPDISLSAISTDNVINAAEDDVDVLVSGTTAGVEDAQQVELTIGALSYLTTVNANAWSLLIPASDAQSLPSTAMVSATVSDRAGNLAIPATLTLLHDTVAPVVTINSAPLINAANENTYTVSGSCRADDGDVSVNATQGTPASQTVSCSPTGGWSAQLAMAAIADGADAVTITVSQTDAAGNVSAIASAAPDKDASSPTISIVNNGAGGDTFYNAAESVSVQVSGTTIGVENQIVVNIVFSDSVNTVSTTATVNANNWDANPVSLMTLADGPITITANVTDAAGNVALPDTDSVTLDATPPVVIAVDSGPGIDTTPLLSGTTDLDIGSTVLITGVSDQVFCSAVVVESSWSCESTIELPEGVTNLSANGVDVAGNSVSDMFTATIDNTIDTDADGIRDIDEGTDDTDGDGTPNYLDTDSDGDGIDDDVETAIDTDGDGIANYIDTDSDNDGIDDDIEQAIDSDGDGLYNAVDLDSDNDGVLDAIELDEDFDNDGIASYLDLDSDNDGVADVVEAGGVQGTTTGVIAGFADNNGDGLHDPIAFTPLTDPDSDGDGIEDRLSSDSDSDGIFDLVEAGGIAADANGYIDNFVDTNNDGLDDSLDALPLPDTDTDTDGLADRIDPDSDGDGLTDRIESAETGGTVDTDADGIPNYLDLDSDGDSLLDADEGLNDVDADGIDDYVDNNALEDTDGDGIGDSVEGYGDIDLDGIPNFQDTDSDGDGIDDSIEGAGDFDGDSLPDFLDFDSDNDGVPDLVEQAFDADEDGVPNYLDTDADGDGIPDGREVGADAESPLDSDNDGEPDFIDYDSDGDGINDFEEGEADNDGDGVPNYLDDDSDGDGVLDIIEGDDDFDGDGINNVLDLDSDDDGILDSVEGSADSDGDGYGNFIDTDADADGIDDNVEGTVDTDGDGLGNYIDTDADGDSLPDVLETQIDTDSDGIPNYRDTDSDDDGLADAVEVGLVPTNPTDTDDDGIANYLSTDSDGDGIDDSEEGIIDTDNDGLGDYIDKDSDADGIPDRVEGSIDSDNDGSPNNVDLDSDGDGINDLVEAGITPSIPKDTDKDGLPDYLDLDSDSDGISDLEEGSVDSDGDGIPNLYDEDSDGDGLPDIDAGPEDLDGDGIPNYLDGDLDGDGISNAAEGNIDSDGDGIVNYFDTESDGDGILDSLEGITDADGDGIANYVDEDADGDGISDLLEAGSDPLMPVDSDSDGIANFLDDDSDADSIPDSIEGNIDTDGDGVADFVDLDSDNDNIADSVEGVVDADADGLPNYIDSDADGDGIGDVRETSADSDADTIPDYLDLDSDADLIPDTVEGSVDSDSDGTADYLDLDSDADGIPDLIETAIDSDGDGISNYVDWDSDGDGIIDFVETGIDPANPVDSDADGTPDYLDLDSDGDGILDADEGDHDSDGDGIPDSRDEDSNNDGILDIDAGNGDADGDGTPDYLDDDIDSDGIPNMSEGTGDTDADGLANYLDLDSDGDGIIDAVEGDNDIDGDGLANFIDADSDGDGISDTDEGTADSDGDTIADFLDADSDNDGITDIVEGNIDSDGDGISNYLDTDSDGDGVLDKYEGASDTDKDGTMNYLDDDSDADGISDTVEAGPGVAGSQAPPIDSDNDYVPDMFDTDSDGDGISDLVETIIDSDGDTIANYLDQDSDADGIADSAELTTDSDRDLIPGFLDLDSDGDGIDDSQEGASDYDGDGVLNYLDNDSDGDGIPDAVEQANDQDGDGSLNFLDLDSDSDGVSDLVEAGVDKTNPVDTDGDGTPDYLDTDSDNDGISDLIEGTDDNDGDGTPNLLDLDDNNDGIPDSLTGNDDTDGDGIIDYIDDDIDGDGIGNSAEGLGDPDGDGIFNFRDLDSDGDGIDDAVELDNDLDGDGIPNFLDVDSDGDRILDSAEGIIDSDADGTSDYLDRDSDNDGIADSRERSDDNDGDGIANYLDLDSDGDTVPDAVEGTTDVDDDGSPNYLDSDSDGDTILDIVEVGADVNNPIDSDADGDADMFDTDSDNDGIIDSEEGVIDNDGDGIPNSSDLDSNNDGIPDADVGSTDTDGDGIADFLDDDIDGDGIPNYVETAEDSDGDGYPNYIDTDSDDDEIDDRDETAQDSDNDGIPNYLDLDSDNDTLSDSDEYLFDTDGDGVPNYIDLDSDNDGIPDSVEGDNDPDENDMPNYLDTDSDGDELPDAQEGVFDSDNDGRPNYLDNDSDNDGIDDFSEGTVDSDGDGTANFLDDDSDGDGISDLIEGGADDDSDGIPNFVDLDSDGDSIPDRLEGNKDSDGDGVADFLDTDSDGDSIPDSLEVGSVPDNPVDSDGDLVFDYLDIDSDGDGVDDVLEGANDNDGDSSPNYLDTDADGDGVDDSEEGVDDTDGDSIPDFLDIDSDADGIPDSVEGTSDSDGDGVPDFQDIDSDGDGVIDSAEVGDDPMNPIDTDSDGLPDYLDTDSDNDGLSDADEQTVDSDDDGIPDVIEGTGDRDADGVPDYLDDDSDGDGIADVDETAQDSDADGIPNYLDLDSDNDGITDTVEAASGIVDTDSDGVPDFLDDDSDNDGIPDSAEGFIDTDGDSIPDYIDFDSDNDSIPDSLEGTGDGDGDGVPDYVDTDSNLDSDLDTDGDGISDLIEGYDDLDGDGKPNYLDSDSDGDGIGDFREGTIDSDGDSLPNYIDTDSDNDGIDDIIEGRGDADGDGVINALDVDSDNDGILDRIETIADADSDGIPNSLDLDSDNDGLSDYFELIGRDSGNDGLVDEFVDIDNDGVHDGLGSGSILPDSDKDTVANVYDIDSDNDGITDAFEAGYADVNNDGRVDTFIDTNGNGFIDSIEGQELLIVDTDGDRVPNYLDTDSDQDGLPDLVEARANGTDQDGYIDGFIDANGDGLDDALMTLPFMIADSDGDSIPDYLEIDSDNDGISDLTETGGIDIDNDGVVDALADADRDGIPDSVDVDFTFGADADNDGIDDIADIDYVINADDSDFDGIIDALDPDADGNGFADDPSSTLALGAALPDIDGDQVPDYQEAQVLGSSDLNGTIGSGLSGNGAGCSVLSGSNGSIKNGASKDPTILLLIVFASLYFLRRRLQTWQPRG